MERSLGETSKEVVKSDVNKGKSREMDETRVGKAVGTMDADAQGLWTRQRPLSVLDKAHMLRSAQAHDSWDMNMQTSWDGNSHSTRGY